MISIGSKFTILFSLLLFFSDLSANSDSIVVIEKERLQSVFQKDQLIYVSDSNIGYDTLNETNVDLSLFNEFEKDVLNTKKVTDKIDIYKKDKHYQSYLILLYVFILFLFATLYKKSKSIFFSFSLFANQLSNFGTFLIMILTCLLASFLFDNLYFYKLFSFFLSYFFILFIIVQFVERHFKIIGLLKNKFIVLFKQINALFCLFFITKIFNYSNVIFPISAINLPTLLP